jgi:tetratricopeptide (TPR) repeat protein
MNGDKSTSGDSRPGARPSGGFKTKLIIYICVGALAIAAAGVVIYRYYTVLDLKKKAGEAQRAGEVNKEKNRKQARETAVKNALRLVARGRADAALALLGNSSETQGEDAGTLSARAEALRALGRPKEAYAALAEARRTGAPCSHVNLVEGNLAFDSGLYDSAEKIYGDAAAAAPSYLPARIALARLYRRRGQPDKARMEIEKAVSLDCQSVDARYERGFLALGADDPASAAADFRFVSAVSDHHKRSFFMLGVAEAACGNHSTALSAFDWACLLESGFEPVYAFRAASELKLNDHMHALRDADEAVALSPENAGLAYAVRAEINFREGGFSKAIEDAAAAVRIGSGKIPELWIEPAGDVSAPAAPRWIEEWFSLAAYRRGVAAFEMLMDTDAVDYLSRITEAPPGLKPPQYYAGLAFARIGDAGKAFEFFNAAVEADPECAEARLEKAKILASRENPAAALAELEKALLLKNPFENALFLKARILSSGGGKFEDAFSAYSELLGISPGRGEYHLERGRLLSRYEKYEEAAADFADAAALMPGKSDAFFERARAISRIADPQRELLASALGDADRAIALGAHGGEAFLVRAKISYSLGEWRGAALDFSEARSRGVWSSDVDWKIGVALSRLGRIEEAKKVLGALEHPAAFEELGRIALAEKKPLDAVKYFSKILDKNPANADAFCLRGEAFAAALKFDSALKDFDCAVALKDDHAGARMARGRIYLDRRDGAKAEADYAKVLELEPKNADALAGRGIARFFAGANAEAAADMEKALELGSKFPNLRGYLDAAKANVPKPK